jgi:cellulose synthase/poly-beta-1,6-N-acetylglucosamine synthase-like glycosyltransferase
MDRSIGVTLTPGVLALDVVAAGLVVLATLLAAASTYLLVLAAAAWWYREPETAKEPSSRIVVLVPAHDEADLIGRCIASLARQDYSGDLIRLVVVADNCSDRTAELARASGVDVRVRADDQERGKGRALRWAMDALMAEDEATDAFVIVDADSVAHPRLLRGLVQRFEQGSSVVQADYSVLCDSDSPRVKLRAVAFLLCHRVRFSGRAVLHMPCGLVGNGMLISREVLDAHPWSAFTSAEDLEYTLTLRQAGIKPKYVRGASVAGPVPATARGSQIQRTRWEGGRIHVVREAIPAIFRQIVRDRRLANLDFAADLMVPPLGILAIGVLACGAALIALWAAGLITPLLLGPSAVALVALVGFVVLGLGAARAPAWMYGSLILAPIFLAEKLWGTGRVIRSRKANDWIRTERPSEVAL